MSPTQTRSPDIDDPGSDDETVTSSLADGDDTVTSSLAEGDQVVTSSLRPRTHRRRCPELTPVIMAAGCGSQMLELTKDSPKCMIPVANIPMIWYPIQFLISHKFEEIYIVVREGARNTIENFVTSELRKIKYEVYVEYMCIDNTVDIGTADSLRLIAPNIKGSDLLVLSSDLITRVSLNGLANLHRAQNAALTALIAPRYYPPTADGRKKRNKKDDRDFIGVDPEDNRLLFLTNEKEIEEEICIKRGQLSRFPHMRLYTDLLDSHLYIVSRTALKILENHPDISMMRCEMLPLLVRKQIKQIVNTDNAIHASRLYSKSRKHDIEEDSKHPEEYFDILTEPEAVGCYVYQTDQFTVRVNQVHNYIKFNKAVSEHMDDVIPKNDPGTCQIHKMTQVGKCSRLGNSVKIAEKCSLKRSFIGDQVEINAHCKIVDCVIMSNVRIEDNVTLTNCIVAKDAVIRSKSVLKDCRVGEGYDVQSESDFTDEVLHADVMFSLSNSSTITRVSSDVDCSSNSSQ